MAKRKLNKRQQWRIEKIQKERTTRMARKEKAVEAQAEAGELGPEQEGLIIAHYGQQLDVEALQGDDTGRVFRRFVRANISSLRTGDRLVWRPAKSQTRLLV